MLEKRVIPHEVLIRYGKGGALQGAHILEAVQILENGEILSDVISEAKPLAIASAQFNEVISEALRQAMARGDVALADLEALRAEHETALQALQASQHETAMALQSLAQALAQLAAADEVIQALQVPAP